MFPIHHLESCTSTNDEIIPLVAQSCSPLALYTFHQTKGRGQYGNTWKSFKHQNLAYSLALNVEFFPYSGSLFNFHTACVLRDILANLTQYEVEIKWPNDMILLGKKVSGMLIEKQKIGDAFYYIIGIGINILQTDFSDLPKASSLLLKTKRNYHLEEFTMALHEGLCKGLLQTASEEAILHRFNQHLFRKGKISVFNFQGMRQNGIIQSADYDGKLWIELEHDGLKAFNNKEIELLY